MELRLCQLDYAEGRRKRCPGDSCPFWSDDRCAVAPLWADFATNPHVVDLLLGMRTDLAHREPLYAFRQFHPSGLG